MAKNYIYRILGKGQFKVIRVDDKKILGDKNRWKEYLVSLKNTDWNCDCESFYYRKKPCKHIKFLVEQLKSENHGVLDFEHVGDYELLAESIKRKQGGK